MPTHIKDQILKIEKQLQDDHQVKLIVEVEPERMEANKRRAARKLAERGKIPGFRPGKAPYDVIRLHYGDEAIIEQAVDFLVDEVYPKALEEADVKPAAPGALEIGRQPRAAKIHFCNTDAANGGTGRLQIHPPALQIQRAHQSQG